MVLQRVTNLLSPDNPAQHLLQEHSCLDPMPGLLGGEKGSSLSQTGKSANLQCA